LNEELFGVFVTERKSHSATELENKHNASGYPQALLMPHSLAPQAGGHDKGAGAFGSRPFVWSLTRR
jgi:hypothetical protein